jgi:hypothetical protein
MSKQSRSIARVAMPLMAATFLSTSAFAQDTAAPVQVTPPAAELVTIKPPAPAPQAATPASGPAAQAPEATNIGDRSSATPVNAEAAAAAEAESQERATAARPQRRAVRTAPVKRRTAAPATRAATEPTEAPAAPAAPVTERAAPTAAAPAAQPAPATPTPATQTTQRTETASATPVWPFVAAGLIILAGIAAFLMRRRRRQVDEAYWDEPATDYVEEKQVTVEPASITAAPVADAAIATPVAADLAHQPVAAAVTPDDASVTEADAEEVAALTAGQTVAGRPWLELAMRPLRAGTRADEAMVEIELTVGNAGEVTAEDVRISTFMLTAESDEMERMLIDPPVDAAVAPVTIDAGEGTRVDATLAVPRASVAGSFQPIVVADARYRLPDGSEGRTSASFVVGVSDEGGTLLQPLDTDRTAMRDDVEARLYREPQRV